MMIAALFGTGLLVGVVTSFFGIGGGAITLPILYSLFDGLSPRTIIGSSLGLIFLNASFNSVAFYRLKERVNPKLVIPVSLAGVLGVFISGFFTKHLNPAMIKQIFGGVLLLVVGKMLFFKQPQIEETDWDGRTKFELWKTVPLGLFSGLLSGITGLGGGMILIPLFISLFKMPYKKISPYSNACMAITTGGGLFIYGLAEKNSYFLEKSEPLLYKLQWGDTNLGIIGLLFIGSILTAKLGIKLNQVVSPKKAKISFAVLLFIFAIKTLVS